MKKSRLHLRPIWIYFIVVLAGFFIFDLLNSNKKPFIAIPDTVIKEGSSFSLNLLNYTKDERVETVKYELVKGPGNISNSIYTYSPKYGAAGTKIITIRGIDELNLAGETSFQINVSKSNRPPEAGSRFYPQNGANGISTDVIFSWEFEDPENDQMVYDLYVGLTASPELIKKSINGSSYKICGLDHDKEYFWKIIARDTENNEKESNILFFTTNNNPSEFSEPFPSNNSVVYSNLTGINWNISDPDGDTLTYDIYFGKSSTPAIIAENTLQKPFPIEKLEVGKTYYWKIVARDGKGGRKESSLWSFETVSPIKIIEGSKPADNSITKSNLLEWNFKHEKNKKLTYDLYLGTGEEPPLIERNLEVNSFEAALLFNTDYHWKVVATDQDNNVFESPIWSFKTDLPTTLWQKSFGEKKVDLATSIIQTTDGDYLIVGYGNATQGETITISGLEDFWLLKFDSAGNLLKERSFGGSKSDIPSCIRETKNGDFIVAGFSLSDDGEVSLNNGEEDAWIIMVNKDLDLIWKKVIGGNATDFVSAIEETSDNGFIVSGYTESSDGDINGDHIRGDAWVFKLSSDGDLLWQQYFGGPGNDTAYSIKETDDNGFIIGGYKEKGNSKSSYLTARDGNDNLYAFVVKTDSKGELEWQRAYGGSKMDYISEIIPVSGGGYIFVGTTRSSNGNISGNIGKDDIWVGRLDENGELLWQKCMGGSAADTGISIKENMDGSFIVSGITASTDGIARDGYGYNMTILINLEKDGTIKWHKCFQGTAAFDTENIANAGEAFAICGYTYSYDLWVAKIGYE